MPGATLLNRASPRWFVELSDCGFPFVMSCTWALLIKAPDGSFTITSRLAGVWAKQGRTVRTRTTSTLVAREWRDSTRILRAPSVFFETVCFELRIQLVFGDLKLFRNLFASKERELVWKRDPADLPVVC